MDWAISHNTYTIVTLLIYLTAHFTSLFAKKFSTVHPEYNKLLANHTSHIKCSSNHKCTKVTQCIRYERITQLDPCCPVCVEYGCWMDDVSYPLGAKIPTNSPCKQCYCPWDRQTDSSRIDGRVLASCVDTRDRCPPVRCVDAVWDEQHCCQHCPNGDNCSFASLILPAGQDVWVSTCQSCYCAGTHVHPRPATTRAHVPRIHAGHPHNFAHLVIKPIRFSRAERSANVARAARAARLSRDVHRNRRNAAYRAVASCYMHEDCED